MVTVTSPTGPPLVTTNRQRSSRVFPRRLNGSLVIYGLTTTFYFQITTTSYGLTTAPLLKLRLETRRRVCRALIEHANVVPDFRRPDSIRLGLPPLYTRFADVWDAVDRLAALVADGVHERMPAEAESRHVTLRSAPKRHGDTLRTCLETPTSPPPAALLGDRARARIVTTLGDGRALPASVLADEAGVAASTASEHLARLVEGGLLAAERHGRHRYFRLAGADVARMLEAMARVSPPAPVTSLREGTQANALRNARTCYDHLAGRLGGGLMAAMISGTVIDGGDGLFDPQTARRDRLSGRGHDIDYRLTARGAATLIAFGRPHRPAGRRLLVGYCVDWSEQRHHLGRGRRGVRLRCWSSPGSCASRAAGQCGSRPRARSGLRETFGFEPDPAEAPPPSNRVLNGRRSVT